MEVSCRASHEACGWLRNERISFLKLLRLHHLSVNHQEPEGNVTAVNTSVLLILHSLQINTFVKNYTSNKTTRDRTGSFWRSPEAELSLSEGGPSQEITDWIRAGPGVQVIRVLSDRLRVTRRDADRTHTLVVLQLVGTAKFLQAAQSPQSGDRAQKGGCSEWPPRWRLQWVLCPRWRTQGNPDQAKGSQEKN